VNGGFVTAGHCGDAGDLTTGGNGVPQGRFRSSSFPGNDFAWVETNASWDPQAAVDDYRGTTVNVAGRRVAPIGSAVCRSGSTTGWRCGTVLAYNATVNVLGGPITGLTRTSACAEGGDSGGPFLWGTQAQGLTSSGHGNCRSGGVTFFQPIAEVLTTYQLVLKVSDRVPAAR